MRTRLSVLLPTIALLGACSYLTPYKLEIPQGNPVTADQAAKLKVGMTRTQVKFVLGTPMLEDAFHQNRWDYQYFEARGGQERTNKRFYVLFDGDRVTGFGGDTLPANISVAEPAPDQMKNRALEDGKDKRGGR
ncbi:outer membrane protein assembly factor BamE [Burkholderiaceae bacterium DAT-1]|nr:outer membrane protein assembly factor BamE [Burkholderiaceae bacterium DAT-1]